MDKKLALQGIMEAAANLGVELDEAEAVAWLANTLGRLGSGQGFIGDFGIGHLLSLHRDWDGATFAEESKKTKAARGRPERVARRFLAHLGAARLAPARVYV